MANENLGQPINRELTELEAEMLEALILSRKYLIKMCAENIECVIPPENMVNYLTGLIFKAQGVHS